MAVASDGPRLRRMIVCWPRTLSMVIARRGDADGQSLHLRSRRGLCRRGSHWRCLSQHRRSRKGPSSGSLAFVAPSRWCLLLSSRSPEGAQCTHGCTSASFDRSRPRQESVSRFLPRFRRPGWSAWKGRDSLLSSRKLCGTVETLAEDTDFFRRSGV